MLSSLLDKMAVVSSIIWHLKALVDITVVDDVFLAKLLEKEILSESVITKIEKRCDKRKFPYCIFLEIDKQGDTSAAKLVAILVETGNIRAAELLDSKQKVKKVQKCPAVNMNSVDRVQGSLEVPSDNSLIIRINNMAGKQNKESQKQETSRKQQSR